MSSASGTNKNIFKSLFTDILPTSWYFDVNCPYNLANSLWYNHLLAILTACFSNLVKQIDTWPRFETCHKVLHLIQKDSGFDACPIVRTKIFKREDNTVVYHRKILQLWVYISSCTCIIKYCIFQIINKDTFILAFSFLAQF